jgi:predicted anti-sigma-YlaC factor YlaD
MRGFVTGVTLLGAALMIGIGAWCRFDPNGFAEWANWPQHEHFLHDAGVFQIAIGVMMLAALWWRDVITVVLVGFVFTNVFHALNHYQDRAEGGHSSDPWFLLLFAVIAGAGLAVRLRQLRGTEVRT